MLFYLQLWPQGIEYYIFPNWSKLTTLKIWSLDWRSGADSLLPQCWQCSHAHRFHKVSFKLFWVSFLVITLECISYVCNIMIQNVYKYNKLTFNREEAVWRLFEEVFLLTAILSSYGWWHETPLHQYCQRFNAIVVHILNKINWQHLLIWQNREIHCCVQILVFCSEIDWEGHYYRRKGYLFRSSHVDW